MFLEILIFYYLKLLARVYHALAHKRRHVFQAACVALSSDRTSTFIILLDAQPLPFSLGMVCVDLIIFIFIFCTFLYKFYLFLILILHIFFSHSVFIVLIFDFFTRPFCEFVFSI